MLRVADWLVAVLVGDGRGQLDQVVRRQRRRLSSGLVAFGMHDRALLVERDIAGSVDADREHQVVADRGAAFDDRTVERQVDRLIGGGVDQARGDPPPRSARRSACRRRRRRTPR